MASILAHSFFLFFVVAVIVEATTVPASYFCPRPSLASCPTCLSVELRGTFDTIDNQRTSLTAEVQAAVGKPFEVYYVYDTDYQGTAVSIDNDTLYHFSGAEEGWHFAMKINNTFTAVLETITTAKQERYELSITDYESSTNADIFEILIAQSGLQSPWNFQPSLTITGLIWQVDAANNRGLSSQALPTTPPNFATQPNEFKIIFDTGVPLAGTMWFTITEMYITPSTVCETATTGTTGVVAASTGVAVAASTGVAVGHSGTTAAAANETTSQQHRTTGVGLSLAESESSAQSMVDVKHIASFVACLVTCVMLLQ